MGEAVEIIAVLSAEAHLVRWIEFVKNYQVKCKILQETLDIPENNDTIKQRYNYTMIQYLQSA